VFGEWCKGSRQQVRKVSNCIWKRAATTMAKKTKLGFVAGAGLCHEQKYKILSFAKKKWPRNTDMVCVTFDYCHFKPARIRTLSVLPSPDRIGLT
jgi:hypothetical protein